LLHIEIIKHDYNLQKLDSIQELDSKEITILLTNRRESLLKGFTL
jgi:hypothetical protein